MFLGLKGCFKRSMFMATISLMLGASTVEGFAAESNTEKEMSHIDTLYLENIYPTYPKTKPATGIKQQLIKRGEYLAKLGDCIACHTDAANGGKPFAGGLSIETPFGVFYSPNITPDKEYGIGTWTEEEFIRSLHEGKSKDGSNLFPVYPYLYFAKVSKSDAKALYAYFMSIPAVKQPSKALGFPFNMPGARFSLIGWKTLFFRDKEREQYKYDPSQTKEWNRGAYIVQGLGHCGMCHTPMNVFGAPKNEYFLTGAFIDGYWAPNISSEGLKDQSRFEVADVFKSNTLLNDAGPVAGPMAEVNHNSLNYLTEEDRLAIATYLKTVVSRQPIGVKEPSETAPSLKRGKQVYKNACIICHQDGKMAAPKIGNSYGWYERVKQQGIHSLYRHTINGYNQMPLKGACVTCSDNDIISAVDYMLNESLTRSQWADLKRGKAAKIIASGTQVYEENCAVCHAKGQLGAPKVGDKQVWKPLIDKNIDVLIKNTINSKTHPKNGGCKHCTSREVIEAVKYMVSKSSTEGNYTLW